MKAGKQTQVLRLWLLGAYRAQLGEFDLTALLRTQPERALLAYLVVESQREHSREALAELFWPERPAGHARTNLRQALHGVRSALADEPAQPAYLFVTNQTLQFNAASPHWLDVSAFRTAIDFARLHDHSPRTTADCPACLASLQSAVDLYGGPFLADLHFEADQLLREWIAMRREQHLGDYLAAVETLADAYAERGELERALEFARRHVSEAPLEESGHRRCMRLLALTKRRAAALAQFEACRRVLGDELGVAPEAETTVLYEAIRSGHLGQAPEVGESETAAPLAEAPTLRPGNLPAPLGFFFGREAELARLAACLRNSTCRLLTLVGLPGAGSTRLALRTAGDNAGLFPDGVWFVDTNEAGCEGELAQNIAQVLGLQLRAPGDPWRQLAYFFHPLTALLILDSLHQAADNGRLPELLERAPGLKVIVTANEQLTYQAACVFNLQGLNYPTASELDQAEGFAAVQLFLAHRNRLGLAHDGGERRAIARICQLVEGLPLAIELAAAAARNVSCADLASALESDLDLLRTSYQDVPPHHRSLRAALDRVWAELSPVEQAILRRTTVLAGEFGLAAGRAVTGADATQLAALAEKSLLLRPAPGRFGLPRLVRQYAAEQLAGDAAEAAALHERHARHYLAEVTQQARALAAGAGTQRAGARLRVDLDNIRQACAWAIAHRAVEVVLPALPGLHQMFDRLNLLAQGEHCFTQLLGILEPAAGEDGHARQLAAARAWGALGCFKRRQGRLVEAIGCFEHILAALHILDERAEMIEPLLGLGLAAHRQGFRAKAGAHLRHALDLAQELGNARLRALAAYYLIEAQAEHGELDQPAQALEACVAPLMEANDPVGAARALIATAGACELEGLSQTAERHLNQALALAEAAGDAALQARAAYGLGRLAAAEGDLTLARARFQMSLAANRQMGDLPYTARALRALAEVETQAGELEAARRWLGEALYAAGETGSTPLILDVLVERAVLLAGADKHEALELLFLIRHHPATERHTQHRLGRWLTELRAAVTPETADELEAKAKAVPLDALPVHLRRWQLV